MIVADECVEVEWVGRYGGQHRAGSLVALDLEGIAITAAPHFEPPATPDEVVVPWVGGKQHADPAIRIGVQHDEIAILCGLDIDARMIAARKLIVIDFD